jgi:predicted nucleic acid-binding protein
MKLAYIDACVWITLVEGLDRYRPPVRLALASLARDGWELCTSDAVTLEVLVRPLWLKQERVSGLYRALLGTNRFLNIPEAVFADALSITTCEGLKAMDAVHVAIAAHHECGRFVTTDPHFRSLKTVTPLWIELPTN